MPIDIDDYRRRNNEAILQYKDLTHTIPINFDGLNVELNGELSLRPYAIKENVGFPKVNCAPFSIGEVVALTQLRMGLSDLMKLHFGERDVPYDTLVSALPVFRIVTGLSKIMGSIPLRVMEIGNSGGHLGSMLISEGHYFVGTDANLGRFLWQNRVLEWFAGTSVEDWFHGKFPSVSSHKNLAVHVPWWFLFEKNLPIQVDIVICDQRIENISEEAADTLFRISRHFLKSSPLGLLVCREQKVETCCSTHEIFRRAMCKYQYRRFNLPGFSGFRLQEAPGNENLQNVDLRAQEEDSLLYDSSAFTEGFNTNQLGDFK